MQDKSFYIKLNDMCKELGMNPRDLLLVMSFESGVNPAASNKGVAKGLIQFMPKTLEGMGASSEEAHNFGEKSAVEQLDWVKRYIEGKSSIMKGQPFKSAAQYYHANFFPATLYRWHGSDAYQNRKVVIVSKFSKDPRQRAAYAENTILDTNKDGYITVADIIRTLAKTAQTSQFQNDLARLNSVAGEGSVSEFANGIPNGKKQQQLAQAPTPSDQDPPQGSIADIFLTKLNEFVSKILGASSNTHLLMITSDNDISSKIEYARILKLALEEEIGIKSNIYTNQDNVDMEIISNYDDISSEKAIIEIANAISNAFSDATKKFSTMNMDTRLTLHTKSALPELDVKMAEQQYRLFNLKIIKEQMATDKPKNSDNPMDVFSSNTSSTLRLFSDELLEKFHGKVLELYIGDQSETLNFEETSIPQNCVIFGRLIAVLDRFIILNCFYVDKSGNVRDDNQIYINTFQIRAMSELNGNGSLIDVFLSCKSAEKVRKTIQLHLAKK